MTSFPLLPLPKLESNRKVGAQAGVSNIDKKPIPIKHDNLKEKDCIKTINCRVYIQ
jgi:hypothetical protein